MTYKELYKRLREARKAEAARKAVARLVSRSTMDVVMQIRSEMATA